jgi:hypothetical protein
MSFHSFLYSSIGSERKKRGGNYSTNSSTRVSPRMPNMAVPDRPIPESRRHMTTAADAKVGEGSSGGSSTTTRLSSGSSGGSNTAVWNPDGKMDQDAFMKHDQCILIDANDNQIGMDNKYESHMIKRYLDNTVPHANSVQIGKLHRAFSVFLFDKDNRLMLQKRASCKITFPDVWTNTCCSHPLANLDGEWEDPVAGVGSWKYY